jgi:hypothetical protein
MNRREIPIAAPCSADWTTMTLADRGRFCARCRKVVHELARLTEAEARRLLSSPPTEGLCVRYIHDARGEIVFRPDLIPSAALARAKRVAAAALAGVAFPLAATGCSGTTLTGSPLPVDPSAQQEVMMGAPPPLPATEGDAGQPSDK